MVKRDLWKSRIGFVVAAAGSAVGLVNIWRFPYIVARHGGSAFILVYLIFLCLIGFPVLVSEVVIGRTTGHGPTRSMRQLSNRASWGAVGMGITLVGFIVSSFYSVVAGWILGYFFLAITGNLHAIHTVSEATNLFAAVTGSGWWCLGYHLLFMILSVLVLVRGVRKGIELANKFLMPILIVLLLLMVGRGLTLAGGETGVASLLRPDWSLLTPMALLIALGHAFFTLSLGQGTMITYGSYLTGNEHVPRTCVPVVVFDTLISLLSASAVLSIVFAAGEQTAGGEGLLFYTLPAAFGDLPLGQLVAVLFFLLVMIAALTSQTSAMEPLINYLVVDRSWKRGAAVTAVGAGGFFLGVPSALAFNWWSSFTIGGLNFFDLISGTTMDFLIPIGGLLAVLFAGWIWGFDRAYLHLFEEKLTTIYRGPFYYYFRLCMRYIAPLLIVIVFVFNLIQVILR